MRWVAPPLLVIASLALLGCASANYTPPPDRGDTYTHERDACPPLKSRGPGAAPERIEPTDSQDMDVAGSPHKDYFMGRWTFRDGNQEMTVTKWCVYKEIEPGSFRYLEYYTLGIESKRDGRTVAEVEPGDESLCPFLNGKNGSSGFQGRPFDQIPKRIDWISGNRHIAGYDSDPFTDYRKVIYEVLRDGTIAKGIIEKASAMAGGAITLKGAFKTASGEYKLADKLTPAERKAVEDEFTKEKNELRDRSQREDPAKHLQPLEIDPPNPLRPGCTE